MDGLGGGVEKIPFQNTDVQWMAGVRSGSEDSRSSGCVAISVLIPGRSRALSHLSLEDGEGDRAKGEEDKSHLWSTHNEPGTIYMTTLEPHNSNKTGGN